MGKRKTRKRSRRSKKGGLGKQFGKSLLIWYGKKNVGKTIGEVKKGNSVKLVQGELPEDIKNFEAVSWYQPCKQMPWPISKNVPTGKPVMQPQKPYTFGSYPEIFNRLQIADHNYLSKLKQGDKFNAFYVSYQEISCYGGERFELLEWKDVTVDSNEESVIVLSDNDWGKGKVTISYKNLEDKKPDEAMVTVDAFGHQVEMNENSILVPKPSSGGKKKRKRRRRSTKKRRRKSKRRRTKKRRRRR